MFVELLTRYKRVLKQIVVWIHFIVSESVIHQLAAISNKCRQRVLSHFVYDAYFSSDERKVQCTICGKCFKNQVQEKSHRKHVHEGRYRYHCGKCGHGVAKRQYLQSHKCGRVRRVQDGEKTIEEHRSEPAEQQQDEQPSLLSAPAVEMNNANMVSAEYGMKPSNEHLVNDMETETLYYSSQPTSTLPSYTQTLSDNRGMIQMPNVVSQAINLNGYMPNCGFLPYPNLNC